MHFYSFDKAGLDFCLTHSSGFLIIFLVLQISRGSPPVTGTFDLSFMGVTIPDIPADVSGEMMTQLLENNLKDDFTVERDGTCAGYNWEIRWTARDGDLPLMEVEKYNLTGEEPTIAVTTLVHGGTWLRPLGGEMLRLPMEEPQVSE